MVVQRNNRQKPAKDTTSQHTTTKNSNPLSAQVISPLDMQIVSPSSILKLQSMLGNQAVMRLMQRSSHEKGCGCAACSPIQRKPEDVHENGCGCPSCRSIQRKAESDGRQVVQAKQDDTLQRQVAADLTLDTFLDAMDDAGTRSLMDHIPSTGLGRFDAVYQARTGKLNITVKAFLDFGDTVGKDFESGAGGWTEKEKTDFIQNFKTQTEAAWSGKYTFTATKAGFEGLPVVTPIVTFEAVDGAADAHFHHRITKKKPKTGIGREQLEPVDEGQRKKLNVGNFGQGDQTERPHDSASTRCRMASHDIIRIKNLLQAMNVNPLRFVDNGATALDAASLKKVQDFITRLDETTPPGATDVPLTATGYSANSERRFYSRGNKAADRAATLQTVLSNLIAGSTNLRHKVETADFNVEVAALKDTYTRSKGKNWAAEDKAKYDAASARQDQRQAEIVIKDSYNDWAGDPYSILAHEFGHMLGNPDEYFDFGSTAIRDKKAAQLIATGNPEDALRAQQIMRKDPTGNASHASAQEAFGNLAEQTGQVIPEFTTAATPSIMSAGANVNPVHYTPLLEALSKITKDTLSLSDWKIGS